LLHLVGYLYYWQMGFNSVFKGLMKNFLNIKLHIYYCLKASTFCVRGCDIDFSLCSFNSLDFCL